ncbi:hypothetical protein BGZ94_001089 [Podila epigama]|nr:hypothetical protein BGZ94_001089 [Podila epigama]
MKPLLELEGSATTLQRFRSAHGSTTLLKSLPTHPSLDDNPQERHIFWTEIKNAFKGIDFLKSRNRTRVLFAVDEDYQISKPLRVKHNPYAEFTVILKEAILIKDEESTDENPAGHEGVAGTDTDQASEAIANEIELAKIRRCVKRCESLLNYAAEAQFEERKKFLVILANLEFFQEKLHARLARTCHGQDSLPKDVDYETQKLYEAMLQIDKQARQVDLVNKGMTILRGCSWNLELAAPRLFIALPTDLDRWKDDDPSTHNFRVYYICDFDYSAPSHLALDLNSDNDAISHADIPQHLHIADNHGYAIHRTTEFFQQFGHYIQAILQMIKSGISYRRYIVPKIETARILSCCTSSDKDHHEHHEHHHHQPLSATTLEPLVDKALFYLEKELPPTLSLKVCPDASRLFELKSYLHLEDDCDDGYGRLHRSIYYSRIKWLCPHHFMRDPETGVLDELMNFGRLHGASIDMRSSSIRIDLISTPQAEEFRNILKGTNLMFDVTVKIAAWDAPRTQLSQYLQQLAETGVVNLIVDGITMDLHPRSPVRYGGDFIVDVSHTCQLQLVTAINYPQPHEQRLYLEGSRKYTYGLSSDMSTETRTIAWLDLRKDMNRFMQRYMDSETKTTEDLDTITEALTSVLAQHGVKHLNAITFYSLGGEVWQGPFEVRNGVVGDLVETIIPNAFELPIHDCTSLRRMTVNSIESDHIAELHHLLRTNRGLAQIDVQVNERTLFEHITCICDNWEDALGSSLEVTLFEKTAGREGRVLAVVKIGRQGRERVDSGTFEHSDELTVVEDADMEVVDSSSGCAVLDVSSWDCDYMTGALKDVAASMLLTAVKCHPGVLSSLTVDTTALTESGALALRGVMLRSSLEHLRILCHPVAKHMRGSVGQILDGILWQTLKSLELSGYAIDEWLHLWSAKMSDRARRREDVFDVQFQSLLSETKLLRLCIQGEAGGRPTELSHTAVLFIHQLIYLHPLQELEIVNVCFQEEKDWSLIMEAVNDEKPELLRIVHPSKEDFV